jgi:hypothetical protein
MTPAIFGLEGLAVTASERAFFKDAAPCWLYPFRS